MTYVGRTDLTYHRIDAGDASPIKQAPRRLPIHRRQEVGRLVNEMEKEGVIQPSQSPWASPIVLVQKKDGSTRFCVDYRRLNKVTRKDSYPLPRVDDILDSLDGAQWFTTLDLASGYWQVEVDPEHRQKTAFTTGQGLYEFRVMPFGLCNAPSTFQRLMELVLAGLEWDTCLAYLDDIVVFGRTFSEHLQRLRIVLSRLKSANLKLSPKKCQFFQQSVSFLGHVISCHGVSTDPTKVESIRKWPVPVDVQELRSFLGLASYYRRFVKGFADIAAPLHRLLQKCTFTWSEDCDIAFKSLKQMLLSAPVLGYPRTDSTFYLDTDASKNGIGVVLSQKQGGVECVIAYGSRALTKSERNYCVTRRELLALVYFMRHFRAYLIGRPFMVRTDHAALQWLQGFKEPEGQVARWLEQLQEFDFHLEHRPGKCHQNADALSRYPCRQCDQQHMESQVDDHTPATVFAVSDAVTPWLLPWTPHELREAQLADPDLKRVIQWLEARQGRPSASEIQGIGTRLQSLWAQWSQLELSQGILFRRWEEASGVTSQQLLVVPQSLVPTVIRSLHNDVGGGHLGLTKTLAKIKDRFYWPGLRTDVEDWCQQCHGCACRKSPSQTPRAPLVPSYVGYPMERIALDLLAPLPTTRHGNKHILVICDYFTRWTEAYALPNKEATTVAKVLVSEWICRYGVPDAIHSDQGANFEAGLFAEVAELLGMEKTRTTAYHPQSDGLVERMNRTLLMMLSIRAQEGEDRWDEFLSELMMAYRASVHDTTRFTPFHLMFGREVRLPIDVMFGNTPDPVQEHTEYAIDLRSRLEKAFESVREHTKAVQKRQKDRYDRRVSGGRYQVGDRVWLHSPAIPRGRSPKLHQPWTGPFVVIKVLSDVTYRIQSERPKPRCRRRRLVVHFNRLKPCHTPAQDGVDKTRQQLEPSGAETQPPHAETDIEDDAMTLVWHSSANDDESQPREPAERGGATWSGRLRRTTHRPDYNVSHIQPCNLITFPRHEVAPSQRGSCVARSVQTTIRAESAFLP